MRDEKLVEQDGRLYCTSGENGPIESMKVMTEAEYQALIDKIARLESELFGKGDAETFKAAEWK